MIKKARTPEREQLAEAIQVVASAKKRLAEIEALYLEYLEKVEPTEQRLKDARAELDAARFRNGNEKLSAHEIAESVARAAIGSNDLHDAVEAIEQIEGELERDKKTRAALKQQTPGAKDDIKRAEAKLQQAIYLVVNDDLAVAALVEKFRRLQGEADAVKAQVQAVLPKFSEKFRGWDVVQAPASSDVASEWRRAVDLLKIDADAAFPAVG
jgi:chromosome segregation ATPase